VRTIAVINQKGGVGKTTTVANLGSAVASRGKDVCLIDLDPQGHLSLHYGVEPSTQAVTIYDVLCGDGKFSDAAEMLTPNLWLVSSSIDLAAADSELADKIAREQFLRNAIKSEPRPHDFILIDCPPSLGLLTINALAAADDVIIPLQPHFLAMQGLAKLLETIQLVQKHINPGLRVLGILLCMYESVMKLTRDVVPEVRNFLQSARQTDTPWSQARIFQSVVRRNIRLAECPSFGKTIFEYDPRSNGAADYTALTEEFLSYYRQEAPPHDTPPEEIVQPIPVAPPIPYPQPAPADPPHPSAQAGNETP